MKLVSELIIPADVPLSAHATFRSNWYTLTRNSEKILIFAADQKMEHLHADFHGENVHSDAENPEHLFTIAEQSPIGAFATHLGLIARYGKEHHSIPYFIKLNGKTNTASTKDIDPRSALLNSVDDVITFQKESHLTICGVGMTIYLGSEYETEMLSQAAQMIFQAHQAGLVAGLWIYPRGKGVENPHSVELTAGAAGVANELGADFVKLQLPKEYNEQALQLIKAAAGNTKVIFAGGTQEPIDLLIKRSQQLIHSGQCDGLAIGRNIFQRSTKEGITLLKTLHDIIYK